MTGGVIHSSDIDRSLLFCVKTTELHTRGNGWTGLRIFCNFCILLGLWVKPLPFVHVSVADAGFCKGWFLVTFARVSAPFVLGFGGGGGGGGGARPLPVQTALRDQ